nr:hypothetical protein [uncultured bacterium]
MDPAKYTLIDSPLLLLSSSTEALGYQSSLSRITDKVQGVRLLRHSRRFRREQLKWKYRVAVFPAVTGSLPGPRLIQALRVKHPSTAAVILDSGYDNSPE